jgi:Rps23 Pro-64 3,4-dihydroxylase Tpa1-like proline 4-hydroxylase
MKSLTREANYQSEYLDLQRLPQRVVTPVMRNDRGMFFFEPDLLHAVAEMHRESFANAAPFPHVVVDGLFPQQAVDQVQSEFPEPSARSDWIRLYNETSAKLAMPHDWTMGPSIRHLLNQFNSAAFVNFLEHLSGIEGLIPDPHYAGGGLHQMERGGFLKVHADFNRHGRLGLDRRLNVLLYLNRDWDDGWGGHLELWDRTMTSCVQRISPIFNRMVVFATTDLSYHGLPDPMQCPPSVTRRSLALYYYTNGRPEHERSRAHSSLYQRRPGQDPSLRRPLWNDFIPPVAGRIRRYVARKRAGARQETLLAASPVQ